MGIFTRIMEAVKIARHEQIIDPAFAQIIRNDIASMLKLFEEEHKVIDPAYKEAFEEFYDFYNRQHEVQRFTKDSDYGTALARLLNALSKEPLLYKDTTLTQLYWGIWCNFKPESRKDVFLRSNYIRIYINPLTTGFTEIISFIRRLTKEAEKRKWEFMFKHPINATRETHLRADKLILCISDNTEYFRWVRDEIMKIPSSALDTCTPRFIRTLRPGVGYVASGKQSEETVEKLFKEEARGPRVLSYGENISYQFLYAIDKYLRMNNKKQLEVWLLSKEEKVELERFLYLFVIEQISKSEYPALRN